MKQTQQKSSELVVDLSGKNVELESFDDTVPAIIEFCSPSSGASHNMSPCFDNLAKKYAGKLGFFRTNLDLNPEAANTHEVSSVPSFVFISHGAIVERLFGVTSKSEIENRILELVLDSAVGANRHN